MRILSLIFLVILYFAGFSQTAPNRYWVKLKDKNHNEYSINNPEQFLSQRAIDRRNRHNIAIVENDLPITKIYIDSIEQLGASIILKSKWFNAITIEPNNSNVLNAIENLSFVDSIEYFTETKKASDTNQEKYINNYYSYGNAYNQIHMHNGEILHNMGFRGEGMYIAIIDAGFTNVNTLDAFKPLFYDDKIIATRDFVDGDNNVYHGNTHGQMVLSTIALNLSGEMVGTAPEASFVLLRSENGATEYKIEEDNWVSAAEFADSIGVDIISTSLGYKTYDNSAQSYTYANMDGKTSRISIGADICSSKGIAVVVSAGNEGSSSWHYITTPADAHTVLTIGAVNSSGYIAGFSSKGPSADGRTKPDIVAVGSAVTLLSTNGNITTGNGTSFATPIIAGLVACLWQVNPKISNTKLFDVIKQCSSKYENPDNAYGYGIPDFYKAYTLIKTDIISNQVYLNSENPFNNEINFVVKSVNEENIRIIFSDILGRIIYSDQKKVYASSINKFSINDILHLAKGIYVLKIYHSNKEYEFKMIKK